MNNIEQLKKDFYVQATAMLEEHNKCLMLLPMGCGKTEIVAEFVLNNGYKNILYLHPSDVVLGRVMDICKDDDKKLPKNMTFMSYSKLKKLVKKDSNKLKGVDLIIVDECHQLDFMGVFDAINLLFKSLSGLKLLGITGVTKMNESIIDEFFDDNVVCEHASHNYKFDIKMAMDMMPKNSD